MSDEYDQSYERLEGHDRLRTRIDMITKENARLYYENAALREALEIVAGDGANELRGCGCWPDSVWILTDAQKEIARAALRTPPLDSTLQVKPNPRREGP